MNLYEGEEVVEGRRWRNCYF